MGKIYIGTSGWHYKHWIDRFYPHKIKSNELLDYYSLNFETVELNNTFYRLPTSEVFKNWLNSVPDNFLFSVKASRIITHSKKISGSEDFLDLFLERVINLKDKLGPILFQLPPFLKLDIDRLSNFVLKLPEDLRFVIEFRHNSWHTNEVYELLSKHNIAFCIFELNYQKTPIITTANFIYVRLHGPEGKYSGSYSEAVLSKWAERILEWSEKGKDVYFYFDNDQNAYAAFNALSLIEKVRD